MFRIHWAVIGILIIATVGCAANAAPTPTPTSAAVATSSPVVTADGIIKPIQTANLAFTVAGRVTAVNVQAGDQVKKGDVLAKLDDTALQKQIAQAESAVALAQAQLDQVKAGGTSAERAAAQAALDAAQKNYDKVRAGPTADELAQLKAQMDNAKALVAQAQAAYDRVGGASNPYIAMTPESAQLQQATNNYNAAKAAFDDANTHPTASELAAAQAQIGEAKAVLANLTPTQDAINVAQAQWTATQAALNVLKANVADYALTAPFDGIVGEENISVGDTVVPGNSAPAFVLGDVSKLRVETTNLAEVDAPRIQTGENVQVTLDAFPGKMFSGKVEKIAPSAVEYRGDRVFRVWIDLNEGVANGLRWGMSTTVKIAVE